MGICEGVRPCTQTAAALRTPGTHSTITRVPCLTVSYRHNCFSFWPHFYTHMGCNQDWKLSRGRMPSCHTVVLFFSPRSLILDFFFFQGKNTYYPDTWMTRELSSPLLLHTDKLCISFVSAGTLSSMYTLVPVPCTFSCLPLIKAWQPQLLLLLIHTWN